MDYILIIGAKSDIAKALAKKYVENGYNLILAARNSSKLQNFGKDLEIRHDKKVICLDFDVLDFASHADFYHSLESKPIGVISVVGYLGNQEKSQLDFEESKRITDTNYTGITSILNIAASDLEKRKEGFIIGISSVAGERGRQSNYTYGAAKAAFTAYLSGLRNRLFSFSVHVMTVNPGFVATKMTEGLNLPKKLTAKPEEVANDVYKSQQNKKNVLYTKWFWRWIILIIKNIPESIFKKLSL